MPLDGARVAIDHHDVVVVDASVDHARSADAEDETCRPIEPQQLAQAYGVVLPVLGRAGKAGSCCTNDPENGPLRHVGTRSEERRGGKEGGRRCRTWGGPTQEK